MRTVRRVGMIATRDECLLEILSENWFLLEKRYDNSVTEKNPLRDNCYYIHVETEEPLNEKR